MFWGRCEGMRRILAAGMLLVCFGAGVGATGWHWPYRRVPAPGYTRATLSFVRPGWHATWEVPAPELANLQEKLAQALAGGMTGWPDHYSWYRLVLQSAGKSRTLYLSPHYLAHCPLSRSSYGPLERLFAPWIARLHARQFGEALDWAEVDVQLPRGGRVRVTDLDTGQSFWLYRYGGELHADVEPHTVRDTEVMRSIFGVWTWRRRAMVVELEGRQVAASLNGMPHGGGRIPGNAFDGHACLHFTGSLTHGTRRTDPAHRLMVRKAAGKLAEILWQPSPHELAADYLVFLIQQDLATLDLMTAPNLRPRLRDLQLAGLVVSGLTVLEESPLEASLQIEANVARAGGDMLPGQTIGMVLRRRSITSPWQVHALTGL